MSDLVATIRPAGSTESLSVTLDQDGTRLGDMLARASSEHGLTLDNVAVSIRRANGDEPTSYPNVDQARQADDVVQPGDEVTVSTKRANG